MEISPRGVALIKQFEGFVPHAYKDPGSVNGLPITIGYGSTKHTDGTDIKLGETITDEDAVKLLIWEVSNKTTILNSLGLNQNQFDSLCSFIYNVGLGSTTPPKGFKGSTLLKRIKANVNDSTIRDAFMMWNKNDGKVMDGLVKRRKQEADLYFKQ